MTSSRPSISSVELVGVDAGQLGVHDGARRVALRRRRRPRARSRRACAGPGRCGRRRRRTARPSRGACARSSRTGRAREAWTECTPLGRQKPVCQAVCDNDAHLPRRPAGRGPPATTNYAIDGPRSPAAHAPLPAPRARDARRRDRARHHARRAAAREQHPAAVLPPARGRARRPAGAHRPLHALPVQGRRLVLDGPRRRPRRRERRVDLRGPDRRGAVAARAWSASTPSAWTRWLDEDEELTGHLRDPYHRVDARRTSRRVEVRSGDDVVARSERPVVVGETGLPMRCYVPREDVLAELRPSDTHGRVPVQGRARRTGRWTASRTRAGPTSEPLEAMEKARGHVASTRRKVEVAGGRGLSVRDRRNAAAAANARAAGRRPERAALEVDESRPVRARRRARAGAAGMGAYSGSVDERASVRLGTSRT